MKKSVITISLLLTVILSSLAYGDDKTLEKLQASIADSQRPADQTARDENRLPLKTMQFFGLKDNMRVMDIGPGAGYYVAILAPVLRDKGELILAVGTDHMKNTLLQKPGYQQVKITSEKTTMERPQGARYYQLGDLDFQEKNLDMVTNFRMYHLFNASDRERLNRAIFNALKPGGIYAIIDHTARHGEPASDANRRRMDPVKAIYEIEAAGFEFKAYSDLHARPQDDLTLEVGEKRVTGQTDRWTFKFIKPL